MFLTKWKPSTLAIHESGHLIAALLFDKAVRFVSIQRPNGGGLTQVETCPPEEDVIITAAGYWAQSLFSSQPPSPEDCLSDRDQIDKALGIEFPCPSPDLVVWREELRMASLKSVAAHEAEIRLVADYLLKHCSIGQEDGSGLLASEIILNILNSSQPKTLTIPNEIAAKSKIHS
jgi:hypothetical protein